MPNLSPARRPTADESRATPTMLLWGAPPGPRGSREPVTIDDPAHRLVGRVLDERYEIVALLARGGMGIVYDAVDRLLDRPVVVKIVTPQSPDPSAAPRLVREARLACRVQHPFIVTVFHLGLLDERDPFIVMERLEGSDLATYLYASKKKSALSLASVVALLEPVAEALAALHAGGIVHRDVKPENVFVLAGTGQPPRVKLIDFGLAMLDSSSLARFTATGRLLGTAEYIAPECTRGAPPSAASDVYALASTVYELLSGELPFAGAGVELLISKTRTDPRPLSEWIDAPWVPRVEAILSRALDRDPAKRPTAMALANELRALVEGPLELPSLATSNETHVLSARKTTSAAPIALAPDPAMKHLVWLSFATALLSLAASLVSLVR